MWPVLELSLGSDLSGNHRARQTVTTLATRMSLCHHKAPNRKILASIQRQVCGSHLPEVTLLFFHTESAATSRVTLWPSIEVLGLCTQLCGSVYSCVISHLGMKSCSEVKCLMLSLCSTPGMSQYGLAC